MVSDINIASDLIKKKRTARPPRPVRYLIHAHLFQSSARTSRPTKLFNFRTCTPVSSHSLPYRRNGPHCIFYTSLPIPMTATRLHLGRMLRSMDRAIYTRSRARARKFIKVLKMTKCLTKLSLPLDCPSCQHEKILRGSRHLSVRRKDRAGQTVKGGWNLQRGLR